jgi:hypothetical protein
MIPFPEAGFEEHIRVHVAIENMVGKKPKHIQNSWIRQRLPANMANEIEQYRTALSTVHGTPNCRHASAGLPRKEVMIEQQIRSLTSHTE